MSSFNEFKIAFRALLLADPGVTTLIGTQLYSAQLATFFTKGTNFPLVTFHPIEGPDKFYWRRFNLRVEAWSDKSYDESHDIFDAIRDVIACKSIKPKSIIRISGGLMEDYDEQARTYSVGGTFLVTQLL